MSDRHKAGSGSGSGSGHGHSDRHSHHGSHHHHSHSHSHKSSRRRSRSRSRSRSPVRRHGTGKHGSSSSSKHSSKHSDKGSSSKGKGSGKGKGGGFSLSLAGVRRKRAVVNAADAAPMRERVDALVDGAVKPVGGQAQKDALVIKLVQNPWVKEQKADAADGNGNGDGANGSSGDGGAGSDAGPAAPAKPMTLEQEAEARLLASMRQATASAAGGGGGGGSGPGSGQPNLVISLDSQSAVAQAGNEGATGSGGGSGSGSGSGSRHGHDHDRDGRRSDREPQGSGRRGRRAGRRNHDPSLKSKLFNHTRSLQSDGKDGKSAPMLLANRVPGITELENDAHKLKHDLSFRPDELTIRSEAYERIPIAEFGAAMLRGMGVTDINSGAAFTHEKRARGLGLGAQEDPVAALKRANKHAGAGGRRRRIPRPGESTGKKAVVPESKKFPGLKRGVVVRITVGRRSGQLGIATQVEGVPGLERMRVRVSETETISIQKKTAVVAKASSLTPEQVTQMSKLAHAESAERAAAKRKEREEREAEAAKRRAEEEAAAKAKADKEAAARKARKEKARAAGKAAVGSIKRSRSRSRSPGGDGHKKARKSSSGRGSSKPKPKPRNWLAPDIRVRVVSKSVSGGRYYLRKGVVVDVPEPCIANLRMDDDGKLVESVVQRRLETVLPRGHSEVVVVAGERGTRGKRGRIMTRDKAASTVAVQMHGTGDVLTLGFDHVTEYVGTGQD